MTVKEKFKKDLSKLEGAVEGTVFLDVKSKLYKKIRKYYENEGVLFSGDIVDDYEILLDNLHEDLAKT